MALDLTKKYLIERGITNVTPDGRIFKDDYEMTQFLVTAKHKFGKDKQYYVILIYDPDTYERQKNRTGKPSAGQRTLLVHRVVYAWFNGECPKGKDIDHIDGNQFNNNINNLQAISRAENLAKRKKFCGYSPLKIKALYNKLKKEMYTYYSDDQIVSYEKFAKIYMEYENKETFLEDMINELKKENR